MSKSMERVSPDKGKPLKNFFEICVHGIQNFKATQPRQFLNTLGLDHNSIQVGFISGQAHHRKPDSFKEPLIKLGILTPSNAPVRSPELTPYTAFGNYSIAFPLKDEVGEIVSLYAYRFKIQTPKGEYLNKEGVYPAFPNERTTRLFLTQNVIDAASLLQSGILENRDAVISLYDGATTFDIRRAITKLTNLESVIIFSLSKNPELIKELRDVTSAKCQTAIVPDDNLNEMWVKYSTEGLLGFINELETLEVNSKQVFTQVSNSEFLFVGKELTYKIRGNLPTNPTMLKMEFEIPGFLPLEPFNVDNNTIDLLNLNGTKELLYKLTEGEQINYNVVISELEMIRDELQYLQKSKNSGVLPVRGFSTSQDKRAKQILESPDIFKEIDDLIEKAGVIGEVNNRLLLFIIASSYRTTNNLHTVIQTSDSVAGSELINKIARLVPELETVAFDVTTSKAFRYHSFNLLDKKLLVIPDYSGIISSKSISDLKRLQARNNFVNDAPSKNAYGELITQHTTVESHTSSIGASKVARKVFSNEPRTVILEMDNSTDQIQKMMEYDCKLMSGLVDEKEQERAVGLLQYILKSVHPLEVVNPHASSLMLPADVPNARNLTTQLLHFTNLIALFRQHQRNKDGKGRVIVQKEDIQTATDIFLNAVVVNTDELEKPTQLFFEKLKQEFIEGVEFTSLDAQQKTGVSKTNVNHQLAMLHKAEYVKRLGHKNLGFTYKVVHSASTSNIRQQIENKLKG